MVWPVTERVPLCVALPEVSVPNDAAVAKSPVDEATEEKMLVDVAPPVSDKLRPLMSPALSIEKSVADDEPMTKVGAVPLLAVGLMESCPKGVEVPIPMKP